MISYNELIEIIDFLSGRMAVLDKFYHENRDDIIADTFQWLDDKRRVGKEKNA